MGYYDQLGKYISRQDLTSDLAIISDLCGNDVLAKLLRRFRSVNVYFDQKPFVNAKKRLAKDLIKKGASKREVAAQLGLFWAEIED